MISTLLSRQKLIVLRLCLSLAFIEGMFVVWKYLTAPSEADSIVFLQYSAFRLILLLAVFFLLLATLLALASSFRIN